MDTTTKTQEISCNEYEEQNQSCETRRNSLITDTRTQSEPNSVRENVEYNIISAEANHIRRSLEEPTTSQSHLNECIVSNPHTILEQPRFERYIGIINARDLVPGVYRTEDFRFIPGGQSPTVRDAAIDLSKFLSYAQRSKYDIVIPASSNHLTSTNVLSNSSGHSYMILNPRYSQNFSSFSAFDYPEHSLNSVSSRNSVLTSNVYSAIDEIQPPAVDFNAPPPYEMPLKLPTYEEVQREKASGRGSLSPNNETENLEMLTSTAGIVLNIDSDSISAGSDPDLKLLGTDFMFGVAFFLALIFNWIGFLLLMCFCRTVAARYGALSGFGLSLAKWTIIVKNSKEVAIESPWVWWLVTAFGLIICIRSLFQYINIKRGWHLMSTAMQERLLFFY
ncbi:hypothetical protein PGB90_005134 [Kerria lacca]